MTFTRISGSSPAEDLGIQSVIDVAQQAAEPAKLETGHVYTVTTAQGVQKIDLTGPEYRDFPSRKTGTTTVRDVDSFLAYFDKHAGEHSEVYADVQARTVTAVLDAHSPDAANWGGHRLVLQLRATTAWQEWTAASGNLMPQNQFAEFVEDHLADIVEPDGATMLEIAESFQATSKAEFQSSQRLATGERKFAYVEDAEAKAGRKGDITIPAELKLALRPFEGAEHYAVQARFRYRLNANALLLGVKLDRPDDVLQAAFADVRTAIDSAVEQPVLNGAPAR